MPITKLQLRPGVNSDISNYSNEGGWVESDKVRFRYGFPQKIGGWTKHSANTFYGVCRSLYSYVTSYNDLFIGMGTNEKVYLNVGTSFFDITPVRTTFTTTATDNCFTTVLGSTTVTVAISGHGAEDGDWVTFSGATAVGGVPADDLNTEFKITAIDTNSFSIEVATAATSAVTGGGTAISAAFQISIGEQKGTFGYGYGTDTYGRLGWGSSSTLGVDILQRDWFHTHMDNDFIFNIREGAPYYWVRGTSADPASALATRAVTLQAQATSDGYDPDAVPIKVGQLLVSQQDKHLIALGAVPFGSTDTADYDPLLIRWADQDTPTQWTPMATNSAGDLRVTRGSAILCGYPTRQEILVFTDSNLYTLQFLGTTDVFGLQEYSDAISLMSPRAVSSANDVVFWMGSNKFYRYDGRVTTLKCTLREHVFGDLNTAQAAQVIAGTNSEWNEVWWFYPSADSMWNDLYVVYNYTDDIWYHGSLGRTAWEDSSLHDHPHGAYTEEGASTGLLYAHEDGVDDDGSAMTAYITSSDFDIGDGDRFALTRRIIPDISFTGSEVDTPSLTMSLLKRNFPGDTSAAEAEDVKTITEATVSDYTDQVFVRARARQMAIKIQSTDIGVAWRLGTPRIDFRQDGRQ